MELKPSSKRYVYQIQEAKKKSDDEIMKTQLTIHDLHRFMAMNRFKYHLVLFTEETDN